MWASVVAVALGSFAYVTAEFMPVGILPAIARGFGVTTGEAGLMLTMPGLFAALGAPTVLLLAGKLNRRQAILGLCALLVVSCGISAVATDYAVMLFSRCLFGFGLGGFWSLAIALAPALVPRPLVTKATATIFAGVTIAMIVGVPIGTYVGEVWGWRATFVVTGVMGALTVLSQYFFLPSLPAKFKLGVRDIVTFWRAPLAKVSVILVVLTFLGHFSTYTYVAPLLIHSGVPTEHVTLVLLGYGLICFLSNFCVAKFLPHRIFEQLIANMLIAAISLLSFRLFGDCEWPVLMGVAGWGIAWGAMPLCLNTFHRHVPTQNAEASSVVFVTACQVAIAAGSGVGGSIVDHLGLLTVFLAGGIFYLVAIGYFAVVGKVQTA